MNYIADCTDYRMLISFIFQYQAQKFWINPSREFFPADSSRALLAVKLLLELLCCVVSQIWGDSVLLGGAAAVENKMGQDEVVILLEVEKGEQLIKSPLLGRLTKSPQMGRLIKSHKVSPNGETHKVSRLRPPTLGGEPGCEASHSGRWARL